MRQLHAILTELPIPDKLCQPFRLKWTTLSELADAYREHAVPDAGVVRRARI